MTQQNIAVIGGGPKAVALAAKAWCLRQVGVPISVTIFERDAIGAAWDGTHGYTDGLQRLCTPAERDLGYPYASEMVEGVEALMQSRFSWSAYQVAAPDERYADWVSRGRNAPTHEAFARYLRHCATASEAELYIGRVVSLEVENDRWKVVQRDPETRGTVATSGFHGVVTTGPGPSLTRFPRIDDPRVFTGETFWKKLTSVRRQLRGATKRVVIIGGGGTSAAIAGWFVRQGMDRHNVVLLSNQATLFTRTTNFFENRIFDDENVWLALDNDERKRFTERLNRGVVWESVTELLSDARRLTLLPAKATSVRYGVHRPGAHRADIEVTHSNAAASGAITADLVVDAAGFDDLWFRKLLPKDLREECRPERRDDLLNLNPDLSLKLAGAAPKLHAPMLSQVAGPGFSSLMALGSMSGRILNPYVAAAQA